MLFSSRAKLYRFVALEWKERGVGTMKVLRHKSTGLRRLLMRREKIFKPCCNHLVAQGMKLAEMPQMAKKAWVWYAVDSSEEEAQVTQFCVKFANEEQASDFKKAFEEAVAAAAGKDDGKKEDGVVDGVGKLSVTGQSLILASNIHTYTYM